MNLHTIKTSNDLQTILEYLRSQHPTYLFQLDDNGGIKFKSSPSNRTFIIMTQTTLDQYTRRTAAWKAGNRDHARIE